MALELISEQRCFGGIQGFYRHASAECGGPMRFSVFQPPQAAHGAVPVLYFLAGLTCTEETFMLKAGAQRVAAELGLMLVAPDTSPRAHRDRRRYRCLGFRRGRRLLPGRHASAVCGQLPHVQLCHERASGDDRATFPGGCFPRRESSATRWAATAR